MTDFPPIKDDLRPRVRLKRHGSVPASDEEIETNSQRIGEKWGVSTHAPTLETPPSPSRVTSIRGYIPEYLDHDLAMKAAERRVTKTFLIIEALAKAGYRVDEIDLVHDRRRNKS